MRAIYYEIPTKSRNHKVNLIPIGDTHIGSVNCDEKKLINLVKWVKETPNTYWIGMGDYIEAININDKRADIEGIQLRGKKKTINNLVYNQVKWAEEILKPISKKCVGLLSGNHEEKAKLNYYVDATSILAEKLNVENLTYSALVRLVFKRGVASQSVIVYAHHGYGGGGSLGGKLTKVHKLATNFDADIYLMGHVHDKHVFPEEQLYMSNTGDPVIHSRKKVFALTGSFFNTYADGYSSYGEKMAYSPIPTGVIKISIVTHRNTRVGGRGIELPPDIHPSA